VIGYVPARSIEVRRLDSDFGVPRLRPALLYEALAVD